MAYNEISEVSYLSAVQIQLLVTKIKYCNYLLSLVTLCESSLLIGVHVRNITSTFSPTFCLVVRMGFFERLIREAKG